MHDVHTSPEFGIAGSWLAEYTLTALDAGVVLFDANGLASQWNARSASLLGVTEQELAGRRLDDEVLGLLDARQRPITSATDPVRRVLTTGDAVTSFDVHVSGSGWRTLSLLPVFGPDRAPRAVLVSIASVDAERPSSSDVEWQLTARSLLKSAMAATLVVDRSGAILEWNDKLLELTGQGEVDLIDAHLEDLCDVDAEWVWQQLRDEPHDWVQGTTWALRPDGSETAVIGRFAQVDWPDHGPAIAVQLIDPYELIHREADARESAELLLFAEAEIPMVLLTDHGIVADANPAALQLFGTPKLAMIGHPLTDHLEGLDEVRLRSGAVEARVRTGRVPIGPCTVRDRLGDRPSVTMSLTSMSVPDAPSPYLVAQFSTIRTAPLSELGGDAARERLG